MTKRFKRRVKEILPLEAPIPKEILHTHSSNFYLNTAQQDRISFSVLRDEKNNLRKIENISYEMNINDNWEWVIRYDDHGGKGSLHRHIRISLKDSSEVQSTDGIKKYKNKNFELTWVCDDIKRNYLNFRKRFRKHAGLDLYS